MNNKKIKKINEYLEDKEDYLITEKNFKFKDISGKYLKFTRKD